MARDDASDTDLAAASAGLNEAGRPSLSGGLGIALNGGGLRAPIVASGFLRGLHHIGVLEKASHVSGISGGSTNFGKWGNSENSGNVGNSGNSSNFGKSGSVGRARCVAYAASTRARSGHVALWGVCGVYGVVLPAAWVSLECACRS